jgi:hypothetical protein
MGMELVLEFFTTVIDQVISRRKGCSFFADLVNIVVTAS